jgi:hypothetical protein
LAFYQDAGYNSTDKTAFILWLWSRVWLHYEQVTGKFENHYENS